MRSSSHQPFFLLIINLPFWILWLHTISLPPFRAWGFSTSGSTERVAFRGTHRNTVLLASTTTPSFFQPHHQTQQLENLKIRFETNHAHHPLTPHLLRILDLWETEWHDHPILLRLLDKTNLYDELEESIMALGYFTDWLNDDTHEGSQQKRHPMVLVDVCCGKGILSLVACYLFEEDPRIAAICMLDKDASVDWSHVDEINLLMGKKEKRPFLVTLPETNLLENTDALISTLIDTVTAATAQTGTPQGIAKRDHDNPAIQKITHQIPMAMIGVHLCKNLSPALVGIINRLGPSQVPFACVAPCCLPKKVLQGKRTHPKRKDDLKTKKRRKPSFLPVLQYESPSHQQDRWMAVTKRNVAKHRRPMLPCSICDSRFHSIRHCLQLEETYPNVKERQRMLEQAAAREPCWKCGELGHVKKDCPSKQTSSLPALISPPHIDLDVSDVLLASDPFDHYCRLLSSAVDRDHVTVNKAQLTPKKNRHSLTKSYHQNWNRNRKSLFIVAT